MTLTAERLACGTSSQSREAESMAAQERREKAVLRIEAERLKRDQVPLRKCLLKSTVHHPRPHPAARVGQPDAVLQAP